VSFSFGVLAVGLNSVQAVPVSLLAGLFVYEARQGEFPAWRGLAPSKNWLGQITLASAIVWSSLVQEKSGRKKFFSAIFLGLSVILLLGSKSTTSMLALGVISASAVLLVIERRLATLGVKGFLSFLLISALSASLLIAAWQHVDVKASFFEALGKDATFTDRIFLWTAILEYAQQHLLTGGGFDGFWVVENEAVAFLYREFVWLPNQAHNGYIDMLNEIGVIGVGLFMLVVISYFVNLAKLKTPQVWKWFIVAALIINLQESTLFRFNAVSGIMFTLAYLAVFREVQLQNTIPDCDRRSHFTSRDNRSRP
jgi:O-antigen ligase